MSGGRKAPAASADAATGGADSHVRRVLENIRKPNGISELHLECGHIVRRRLAFCPPTRLACERCRTNGIGKQSAGIR